MVVWKHKNYLPSGGNCFVFCNSTGAIGSVILNGVKQVVVYVSWTQKNIFRRVTHECMSYVLEVLFLFWLVVMSLLSSWYEMDVRVELLAYDIWSAENDKTGFLIVGVDIFDQLYLTERPISLPMTKINIIKRNYENEDNWESWTNRNMRFFMNDQNILFG